MLDVTIATGCASLIISSIRPSDKPGSSGTYAAPDSSQPSIAATRSIPRSSKIATSFSGPAPIARSASAIWFASLVELTVADRDRHGHHCHSIGRLRRMLFKLLMEAESPPESPFPF